jgi:predicted amidophosphoribosyltransferase
MPFPIRICAVCQEEFELKPDKPGFANRCPECSEPESSDSQSGQITDALDRKSAAEANEARREAMKNLLYRKDS